MNPIATLVIAIVIDSCPVGLSVAVYKHALHQMAEVCDPDVPPKATVQA